MQKKTHDCSTAVYKQAGYAVSYSELSEMIEEAKEINEEEIYYIPRRAIDVCFNACL